MKAKIVAVEKTDRSGRQGHIGVILQCDPATVQALTEMVDAGEIVFLKRIVEDGKDDESTTSH